MDLGRHQQVRARTQAGGARSTQAKGFSGASQGDPALENKRLVTVRALLPLAAELLGFAVPERAFELIDNAAITYDSDGYPINLPDLLEELLQGDPSLSKWFPGTKDPAGVS